MLFIYLVALFYIIFFIVLVVSDINKTENDFDIKYPTGIQGSTHLNEVVVDIENKNKVPENKNKVPENKNKVPENKNKVPENKNKVPFEDSFNRQNEFDHLLDFDDDSVDFEIIDILLSKKE